MTTTSEPTPPGTTTTSPPAPASTRRQRRSAFASAWLGWGTRRLRDLRDRARLELRRRRPHRPELVGGVRRDDRRRPARRLGPRRPGVRRPDRLLRAPSAAHVLHRAVHGGDGALRALAELRGLPDPARDRRVRDGRRVGSGQRTGRRDLAGPLPRQGPRAAAVRLRVRLPGRHRHVLPAPADRRDDDLALDARRRRGARPLAAVPAQPGARVAAVGDRRPAPS